MKKITLVLLLVVMNVGYGESEKNHLEVVSGPGQHAQFFEKEITKKAELGFWLYLPEDYGVVEKEWPMVLFLHGGGERGDGVDDLHKVLYHGLPALVKQGKEYPFVIVSPQCPSDLHWGDQTDELAALCDYVADTYAVDNNRLYITGLSMGGAGTWSMIEGHPEKFAAAVPICGRGNKRTARKKLIDLPIWVFHGAKDHVVPISQSQEMVDALKEGGSTKVKFTVYPEEGHGSWGPAYISPELYEWLLSQHKGRGN